MSTNLAWGQDMKLAKVQKILALLGITAMVAILSLVIATPQVQAEYGDVVLNNYSDKAGMRPVVFPHWFHRVRFRCKACHADLGIKFKAGGNEINMVKIIDGQYCGACHNSKVAWGVESCDLCHSGKPGTPTQVHESTINLLAAPGSAPPGAGPSTSPAPAAKK